MAGGWGHALAAAVGGWQKGAQQIEDKKERDEDRRWREEQRDFQRQDRAEKDAEKQALKDAGRPIALEAGAGGMLKPPEMDNRDVGLTENAALPDQGLQQGGYRVGAQTFADRTAAEAAVTQQNTPEATNQRVAQAYRGLGQHDKAMAMESGARNAELQTMQLADQRWKRDLGKAMRGGHEGLAQLATTSDAGPMAGLKVKAAISPDGKTVTYAALDKDGNANPIPGLPTFTNDQNGMTQAAWMLDQTIDPSARMAHYTAEKNRDEDRGDKKETREEARRHNMAMEGLTARGLDIRASTAGANGKGKGKGKGDETAPFDPLSDFDPKQARKEAMELAGKEAEAKGVPYSEQRAQQIYGRLRDAASTDNVNRHVQQTVTKELRASSSDPADYAATYAKAKQVANPEQLAAWGFKAPGASAGSKPASPAGARTAPVAAVSAPPAAAQAASSPADAAGARLDVARQQLAALRSAPAPGLAAGRGAIDSRAAQVDAARQAVAQAEAEYQRLVPNSGAAFVRPSK